MFCQTLNEVKMTCFGCVEEELGHRQSQDRLIILIVSIVNHFLFICWCSHCPVDGHKEKKWLENASLSHVCVYLKLVCGLPLCIVLIIEINFLEFHSVSLASTWSDDLSYQRLSQSQ